MRYTRLLIVLAPTALAIGYSSLASSSSPSTVAAQQEAPDAMSRAVPPGAPGPLPHVRDRSRRPAAESRVAPGRGRHGPPRDGPRRERRGALGEAEGAVPDDTTPFDDQVPGVAHLDSALLAALREAARAAAEDGFELVVNSGWRSPEYQDRLLREAASTYGSDEEAARWVATPTTSLHVSGEAVDVGPAEAVAWLSEHGARYGLCQIYRNEPWHYELRPRATDRGCPRMYEDPTHDPRMQMWVTGPFSRTWP